MEELKRATIYVAAEVQCALRLRAAACNRSLAELVNEAVHITLAEDADDLRDVEQRQKGESVGFEEFVCSLRGSGRIQPTIKPSAAKELEPVADAATLARLVERIQTLASLPKPSGPKKLATRTNLYRILQGNYRRIYCVNDQLRVVDVVRVGPRRDVYR